MQKWQLSVLHAIKLQFWNFVKPKLQFINWHWKKLQLVISVPWKLQFTKITFLKIIFLYLQPEIFLSDTTKSLIFLLFKLRYVPVIKSVSSMIFAVFITSPDVSFSLKPVSHTWLIASSNKIALRKKISFRYGILKTCSIIIAICAIASPWKLYCEIFPGGNDD